jgi:hypothetical protein
MAMFGPAGQMSMAQLAGGNQGESGQRSGPFGFRPASAAQMALQGIISSLTPIQRSMYQGGWGLNIGAIDAARGTRSVSQSVSPGQTQVIRPSQQQQQRAQAPQAGASSSLITSTPSPAEVALATTSLLGG